MYDISSSLCNCQALSENIACRSKQLVTSITTAMAMAIFVDPANENFPNEVGRDLTPVSEGLHHTDEAVSSAAAWV